MKTQTRIALLLAALPAVLSAQEHLSASEMARLRPSPEAALGQRLQGFSDAALVQARFAQSISAKKATASGRLPASSGAPDRIAGLIVNGQSQNVRFLTVLQVFNLTDDAAEVFVDFYDDRGIAYSMPILNDDGGLMGDYESLYGTIPARGLATAGTYPLNRNLGTAYARFRSVPEGAVEVNVMKVRLKGNDFWFGSSLAAPADAERFMIWSDQQSGRVNLVNAAPVPATVTARVRNAEGREICRVTRSVAPGTVSTISLPGEVSCVATLSGEYNFDIQSSERGLAVGMMNITSTAWYFNDGLKSR